MLILVLQWVKCRLENADCNSRLLVKNWGYVNYFRYMYILTSWFVDKRGNTCMKTCVYRNVEVKFSEMSEKS